MIKKLIDKLFSQKITDEDIECAIDDNTVDCSKFDDDQDKASCHQAANINVLNCDTYHLNWIQEDLPSHTH